MIFCCSILGGELFDRVICDDFVLTERACVCFMRQVCEGMRYMHSRDIIHLDMKVSARSTAHTNMTYLLNVKRAIS